MNQTYGSSRSGNLKEALQGIQNPSLLIMMSTDDKFEQHVEELEKLFPGVPSIGCVANSYEKSTCEGGVGITAFSGVDAVAGVLRDVSTTPVRDIRKLEENLRSIHPEAKNTVCIDLCSGNDATVLATINSVLQKNHIQLMGATGDTGRISANGQVYKDADAYAFVKNRGGKVKVYKENLYRPMAEGYRFIASHTDRSKYLIGQLNGKPAKRVYMDTLGIRENEIPDQTFKNPFGKMVGNDICIISIKEVMGDGIACYRQVNDSDVLTLLELRDYKEILADTASRIRSDFSKVSGIYSVNCAFRYIVFTQNGDWNDYLNTMTKIGPHCGLVGFGEHVNDQFINQTMTCVVFE